MVLTETSFCFLKEFAAESFFGPFRLGEEMLKERNWTLFIMHCSNS